MTTSTINFDIPLPEPRNAQELVDLVQTTISQIQDKFGLMSDSIMVKINDMGQRVDTLERDIAHIISKNNAERP